MPSLTRNGKRITVSKLNIIYNQVENTHNRKKNEIKLAVNHNKKSATVADDEDSDTDINVGKTTQFETRASITPLNESNEHDEGNAGNTGAAADTYTTEIALYNVAHAKMCTNTSKSLQIEGAIRSISNALNNHIPDTGLVTTPMSISNSQGDEYSSSQSVTERLDEIDQDDAKATHE